MQGRRAAGRGRGGRAGPARGRVLWAVPLHLRHRRQASVSQLLVPSACEHLAGNQMPCAVLGEAAGRPGAPRLPLRRLVPRVLSVWPVFLAPVVAKGGTGTVLLAGRCRHGRRGDAGCGRRLPGARCRAGGSSGKEEGVRGGALAGTSRREQFPSPVCFRIQPFPPPEPPRRGLDRCPREKRGE